MHKAWKMEALEERDHIQTSYLKQVILMSVYLKPSPFFQCSYQFEIIWGQFIYMNQVHLEQITVKSTQLCKILCVCRVFFFPSKFVYQWRVNGDKSRYSESKNLEVRQAHPFTKILKTTTQAKHLKILKTPTQAKHLKN